MANRQADGILHGLNRLVEAQAAHLTDGQLLRRFAFHRDEGAFAALVQRHAALVYGVCRNILRHEHDAEDAFQGTFMVLARRAGAIREHEAVGSWLFRVAYRVSMKARTASARRRRREDQVARPDEDRTTGELAWRELQAMLDEELNRLPYKYRAPFVLCCLTGKSKAEAAVELGWKEGTVSSRLAQARTRLRTRLARRGVTLSALLSGMAIAQKESASAVPATLLAATRQSAPAFAAGNALADGAASVPASLAKAVLRGMALDRIKVVGALVAVAGLFGTAAAVAFYRPSTGTAPDAGGIAVVALPEPVAQRPGKDPAPARRITVRGSVLGPDGNPVPSARIAVTADHRPRPGELRPFGTGTRVLGEGQADGQGEFRLAIPQTSDAQGQNRLTVVAHAPGYALSSHSAEPQAIAAPDHDLPVQLVRGHTVRCRLLNAAGESADGVQVHVLAMARPGTSLQSVLSVFYYDPPVPIPGWPDKVVTDAEGFFSLANIAPHTKVYMQVRDDRHGTQWFGFETGPEEKAEPVVLKLLPTRTLDGRVTAGDTGVPVAGATLIVETQTPYPDDPYTLIGTVVGQTDENGCYRVRPFPRGNQIRMWVYPPAGEPYLSLEQHLKWPADAGTQKLDLPLPRGILVRGTVEEVGTGRRVAGAAVQHEWGFKRNPFQDPLRDRRGTWWKTRDTVTGPDGTFTMAVPPGPGALLVKAAEPDYVHVEFGSEQVDGGTGGIPSFPDAFAPLKPQPGDGPLDLTFRLRRGVTVRGRVTRSDGKPPATAFLYSATYIPVGTEMKGTPLRVQDGRFELPGCEPGGKVKVWIIDPEKKEGTVAELAVGGKEPEIRLAPCVSARVRVVDQNGLPVAAARLTDELVLRPGDEVNVALQKGTRACVSLYPFYSRLSGRSGRSTETSTGTHTLPLLIPGAEYAVRAAGGEGYSERLTFTAPLTGSADLGRLTLTPPR
ncbi:MAG TPA: sigma-70 family RNA polymerase sigma factor [Gemmataceae bacterium]|nr:sigma-70 family RNA polymerase sigma factor [Gemmataceae bacterium]